MSPAGSHPTITRRRALAMGGGLAGALVAVPGASAAPARRRLRHQHGTLPAEGIQAIIEAEGTVEEGVLGISVDRDDIGDVTGPGGVPFKPSFQIHGDLTFQPLGRRLAFLNADLALKPSELNPVIDALLAHGLVVQAEHQHFFDLDPMVWFIHFRGVGAPLALARAVRAVLRATSTPLPQTMPANPTTPLDVTRLEQILHGTAEVGADGVVTVTVERKGQIVIDDVVASPNANISTNVGFEPLDAHGTRTAVAPDFSMTTAEVNPVLQTMRRAGFEVGCLYNQETGEHPQLYFSHMFAAGDPYALARAVRRGIDHTRAA